jgi:hypothetical protein
MGFTKEFNQFNDHQKALWFDKHYDVTMNAFNQAIDTSLKQVGFDFVSDHKKAIYFLRRAQTAMRLAAPEIQGLSPDNSAQLLGAARMIDDWIERLKENSNDTD